MNDIAKIVILIELENGKVHQVLATKEQKEIALHLLKNEKTGTLQVTKEIEPIEFKDVNSAQ